ncbi:TM1266 family iron-only hydrogenase system putative regulator [Zongyangia hominis]|uniref:Iron-only hydrogenase system regulator n=1 Tax=Zongyangia hominis TaxID=2763677 RepID=A0A926EAZ4_9FIRM|nr:TM1266 family iron-only hydrogenase system putative regulator [Zongyangia hominis]MBC8569695.1 iron-only hydrogenase system regulator [Zongyangia hominis]
METKLALIGIVVEEENAVQIVNELLHQYAPYVVGRMGLPYREKGVSIISVVVDAPENVVSALSGKLGNIKGIGVKSLYAKTSERR